jgi:hypothetical protein
LFFYHYYQRKKNNRIERIPKMMSEWNTDHISNTPTTLRRSSYYSPSYITALFNNKIVDCIAAAGIDA